MSERKQSREPIPLSAGGHFTWQKEREATLRILKKHGITIEHEISHSHMLPTEDNLSGIADNFSGERQTFNWSVEGTDLVGVSYSYEEMLGDIIDAFKDSAKLPEAVAFQTMDTSLKILAALVNDLRTELLAVKVLLAKKSEQ